MRKLSESVPMQGQLVAVPARQHSAHSVQRQAGTAAGAAPVGAAAQTAWRQNSQEPEHCPG